LPIKDVVHLSGRSTAVSNSLPSCIHFFLEARSRCEFCNIILEAEGNESLDRNLGINVTDSPRAGDTNATLAAIREGFMRTKHWIVWNGRILRIRRWIEGLTFMLWTNGIYDLFGFEAELLHSCSRIFGKISQKFPVVNVEIPAIPKEAELNHILQH
jgi:hypothetical protein